MLLRILRPYFTEHIIVKKSSPKGNHQFHQLFFNQLSKSSSSLVSLTCFKEQSSYNYHSFQKTVSGTRRRKKALITPHYSPLLEIVRDNHKMTSEEQQSKSPAAGDRDKCIFCKIVDGKEGNEIFYQDDDIVVFQDIKPASKHHLLVVPREHIRDSKSLTPSQLPLAKRLVEVGKTVLLDQMKKDTPELESLPADLQILMGYHWPPFHTVSHLHLHVIAPSDQIGFVGRTIFRPNSFWFVTPEYIQDRLEKMAEAEKANGNAN